MKCPSCNTTNLEEYRREDLVIDICPNCDGMWFDNDEMQGFVDFLLKENTLPEAKIATDKKAVNVYRLNEPANSCPRCNLKMNKYSYAYDSNVILDKCPSCKGVWADGKEIYQIAVHVKGNPALEAMGKAIVAERGSNAADGLGEAFNVLGIIGKILLSGKRRRHRWTDGL